MKVKALIFKAAGGRDPAAAGSSARLWEGACEWEVGSRVGGRGGPAAGTTYSRGGWRLRAHPENTATSSTKTLTRHKGSHLHGLSLPVQGRELSTQLQ